MFRRRGTATFALLVLVAEVVGRSLTTRVDRAFHVAPLAPTGANYYPFLLVGLKVVGALALRRAARAARPRPGRGRARASGCSPRSGTARGTRRGSGRASRRGSGSRRSPRPRSVPRPPDAEERRRRPLAVLAPWLHTYALPVFAVVSRRSSRSLWRVRPLAARRRGLRRRTFARVRRLLRRRSRFRVAAHAPRPTPRRAAASASPSSRGRLHCPPDPRRSLRPPRATVSFPTFAEEKCKHTSRSTLDLGRPARVAARAQVVSFIGPLTVARRRDLGDRPALPADAAAPAPPGLLVARWSSRRCSSSLAGIVFALVVARPLLADLEAHDAAAR